MNLTQDQNINTQGQDVYLTFLQLKYDCETVYSVAKLLQRDGITCLEIIPYLSLTTNNILELLSEYQGFNNTDTARVEDVRLKLKIFGNRYGESKKMILNVDFLQDQFYKNRLAFKFMKDLNIHKNLGVYTNAQKKVIGNTQYIYYILQDDRFLKNNINEVAKAYAIDPKKFDLNKQAGQESTEYVIKCMYTINTARKVLKNFAGPITLKAIPYRLDYYYADCNTNVKSVLFPRGDDNKATQIYLLHILSIINFLLYVLNRYAYNDYGWWGRINYIVYYYSISKLRDMQEHFTQNGMMTPEMQDFFRRLDIKHAKYLSTDFRSCMMHSKLYDKYGNSVIASEYLNLSEPFFGLVETCFQGASYQQLKKYIISELKRIAEVLSQWLGTEHLKVKPLSDE